jgi:hypothetical protein
MTKRRRTDNTMTKRRRTDNTMTKRRRTDNTMTKQKVENTTKKTKDRVTRTTLKLGVKSGALIKRKGQ